MPQDVPIAMPFPSEINPLCEEERRRSLQWATSFSLAVSEEARQRLHANDMPGLMSRWYPAAAGPDLALATDAQLVAMLFDEQFDSWRGNSPAEATRLANRLVAVMKQPVQSGDPLLLEVAFRDVWSRLTSGMSATWVRRTTGHWADFFNAHVTEAKNRSHHTDLTISNYLLLRRRTGIVNAFTDLIERVGHFEIPGHVYAMPEIHSLCVLVADVIDTINDVHSLEKEEARGDPHNLITVVRHERQCSRQVAISLVQGMIHHWIESFIKLAAELPEICRRKLVLPQTIEDLGRLVTAMKASMRGYLEWSATTVRYNPSFFLPPDQDGYLEDLLVPATDRTHPDDGVTP